MKKLSLKTLFDKDSIFFFFKLYAPAAVIVCTLFLVARFKGFCFADFTRDPIQLLNGKPYYGLLSSIGIIIWSSTTAILFFSAGILRFFGAPRRMLWFLFFSGLLTMLMLIDDFFLFHDVIFPEYLHINEKVFYCFYGISVVAIFYFFRDIVLKSDYVLIIFSFGFLAASASVDVIIDFGFVIHNSFLFEDGFKFFGIVSWAAFFISICIENFRSFREVLTT